MSAQTVELKQLEGKRVIFTAQAIKFYLRAPNTYIPGEVASDRITLGSRVGVFYIHETLLTDEVLAEALRMHQARSVGAKKYGFLVWEGVVTLGALSGFSLFGEVRRPTEGELVAFVQEGRF
jgi:hypothetical protein